MDERDTICGMTIKADPTSIRHFTNDAAVGTVWQAAGDCLREADGLACPLWFWFNGTFAPVLPGDNVDGLVKRWATWRDMYQRGDLLEVLQALVGGQVV
jgi:hypothetical protein